MSKVLKWILGIVAALAIAAAVCFTVKSCEKEEVKTFAEYVAEDYAFAKTFVDNPDDVCFYEVEAVLNGLADEVPADELKVVTYQSVFQTFAPNVAHFRDRDVTTGEYVDYTVDDLWLGDDRFDPTALKISFDKAVELMHAADVIIPSSNKVTLRAPVGPTASNPLWIFGSTRSAMKGQEFVAVDAITGEVRYIR